MNCHAEQAILGAALLSPDALRVARNLLPDDRAFRRTDHRRLWRAILSMHDAGIATDVLTLAEWLGDDELVECGGQSYLAEIVANTASTANIEHHATIVLEDARKRKLSALLTTAQEQIDRDPAQTVIAELETALADLRVSEPRSEIVDLFADHGLPALPLSALPSTIADFAADRADLIGCDPAAIAIPALVTCGALLPDQLTIQPKRHDRTWHESARLWALLVGPPAAKKSPGLKAAGGPAFAINSELATANAAAMLAYEEDAAAARKAKEPPPMRPPWQQLIVQDTTIEALSDALLENPRGVLMLADELSEWIGSMDAYSAGRVQKDRPAWLQAFEGGPRSLNRVMRGRAVVPNWSVAIVGGIQPDVVRRLLGGGAGAGDGLTQRFLAVTLTPARMGADRPDDAAAASAYKRLARGLWEIRDEEATVSLSAGAHEVYREYVAHTHGIAQSLGTGAEAFGAHLGKWEGIIARLILTFHAIESAAQGQHPASCEVPAATVERVTRFAREYLFPHAAHFYGDVLSQRTHAATAAKIGDLILTQGWHKFTSRDIAAQWKAWRGFDERYQAAVLAYLEMAGWIREAEPPVKPGRRPSDLYRVNRDVHTRFEKRAAVERDRRAKLRDDWEAATRA